MTDKESKNDEKKPVMIKNATDLQRLKLEKLMKNPDKPVILPDPPKQKSLAAPPDFVRNVMGSSAGAGSGEFHVYRHLRRKEYARQKFIQEKSEKEKLDDEYHRKIEENRQAAEERTAKKRAKRLKKKNNAKVKAKKPKSSQQQKVSSSDSSSEDDDDQNKADDSSNQSEESKELMQITEKKYKIQSPGEKDTAIQNTVGPQSKHSINEKEEDNDSDNSCVDTDT